MALPPFNMYYFQLLIFKLNKFSCWNFLTRFFCKMKENISIHCSLAQWSLIFTRKVVASAKETEAYFGSLKIFYLEQKKLLCIYGHLMFEKQNIPSINLVHLWIRLQFVKYLNLSTDINKNSCLHLNLNLVIFLYI